MLGDADPRHRVSAVWVARSCRARALIGDLHDLADGDRFAEIRARAAAAVRLLDHRAPSAAGAGGRTT
jgi:hypothetical protein